MSDQVLIEEKTFEEHSEAHDREDLPKRSFKQLFKDYGLLIAIAGGIVALDQWTKTLVRTSLTFGETWAPWEQFAPYFRIVHWRNTGAAFGIFQDGGMIFTILAILVAFFILYYYPQVPRSDWSLRVAMGLQLGGALGNMIDRFRFDGSVIDFISVSKFPVFNVADSSISIGVAVLVVGVWLAECREKKAALEEVPASD